MPGDSPSEFDLSAIPVEARELFSSLLRETPDSPAVLATTARDYAAAFRVHAAHLEFSRPDIADTIRDLCLQLVDHLGSSPDSADHRLVHAAVRYFVIEDDGDSDSDFGGLDDDLAVVQAVARHLDLPGQGGR